MKHLRHIMLVVFAVSAVGALTAASASAANDEWTLGAGTFPATVSAVPTGQVAWKLAWNSFETECKTAELGGAQLETGGKASATSITFKTCTVTKPASGCAVETGEIKTAATNGQLTEAAGVHSLSFNPTTPPNFTTFKLTGTGCGTAKGAHTVKGKATCEGGETSTLLEELKATHKLLCNVTKAKEELEVGSEFASLTGEAAVEVNATTGTFAA